MIKNILKKIFYILIFMGLILSTLYILLSLFYRVENFLFSSLNILVFLTSFICLILSFKRKYLRLISTMIYFSLSLIWFLWYQNIQPSNDRIWQKDVAILSYATLNDNLITVHNIRNIKYVTEDNYEVKYYDETFDINELKDIDFIATYWMGANVAHTFLSFTFKHNKHLAISIEARKEVGESYSMLKGFFKDNELYYVVADERDLIGVRTNIRHNPTEHVYMYQIDAKPQNKQKIFLNYIAKLNKLKNNPEFYNTFLTNCTTGIWNNSLVEDENLRFNWKILVSGHTASYLYENGLLKTYGLSFKELEKKVYINPFVDAKPIDEFYSSKIRKGF